MALAVSKSAQGRGLSNHFGRRYRQRLHSTTGTALAATKEEFGVNAHSRVRERARLKPVARHF
eukprot:6161090-Pleurochrysis_carterae.AAC.2